MAKKKTDQTAATVLDDTETAAPQQVAVLRITAKREGFRRAGRAWGVDPVEIARDEMTDEQIGALMNDPMLTVEEAGE